MGLFKGIRDMSEIYQTSKQFQRPPLGASLSTANELMQGLAQSSRLLEHGLPGEATLTAVADTGATANDQPVLDLQVEVTVAGRAPYAATIRQPTPRLQAPSLVPGLRLPVRVDPDDPANVVVDWRDQVAQATRLADAGVAAAAQATAQHHQDPVERLERLQQLREKGLLTDAEFAAQKARVLGEI